jgi:transcriptional regulator with XRE-family HTH domain
MANSYTRDEIKAARERAGLSQRGLARLSGMSQSRIAQLESANVPARITAALRQALDNQPEA